MLQTKQRTIYNKQIQQKRLPGAKARLMESLKQSNGKESFLKDKFNFFHNSYS